jgi:catechol 2,3-dioxygenase-like lactoylglutathione lyase family enzyme
MNLKRIHHVAYRCKDARETVEFYQRVLNMDFTVAFAEDQVPSTKEPDPYMHVFLDCGMGNVLAFFELPTRPEMDRDHNTPQWVQHIAFEVEDYDALLAAKEHVQDEGIDVIGSSIPTAIVSNSLPTRRRRNRSMNSSESPRRCSKNGAGPTGIPERWP